MAFTCPLSSRVGARRSYTEPSPERRSGSGLACREQGPVGPLPLCRVRYLFLRADILIERLVGVCTHTGSAAPSRRPSVNGAGWNAAMLGSGPVILDCQRSGDGALPSV